LVGLCSGCTFYTACPTGGSGTQTPGGAGNGGNNGGGGGEPNSVVTGPTPAGQWVNVTDNLAQLPSECGNLSTMSSKPDEDVLIVSVAQQGLWSSTADGEKWQQLGTGKRSEIITNRGSGIIYDPTDANTFYESGIYNGNGVYVTHDDGVTFAKVGNITHNDYVSVDFTDPDRNTMLASEHEKRQALMYTGDQGDTWTEIGPKVPAEAKFCSFPLVLDASTFLLGCGVTQSGDGVSGIYKSTDTGETWTSVSPSQGGASAPLLASDGSMYWVTEFGGGMVRSEDQGDTWTTVVGPGVIINVAPVELPDGRIAVAAGRHILVSADHGATFRIATSDLGFDPAGITYSRFRKAFYAWHASCTSVVPSDAVMRFDFDYELDAL
jgi:photosystem II stability/assembly factor-like uncharacterized protein